MPHFKFEPHLKPIFQSVVGSVTALLLFLVFIFASMGTALYYIAALVILIVGFVTLAITSIYALSVMNEDSPQP